MKQQQSVHKSPSSQTLSEESSDDDSSDESTTPAKIQQPAAAKSEQEQRPSPCTAPIQIRSTNEDMITTKKRRTTDSGNAVATAAIKIDSNQAHGKKTNTPFRRVNTEAVKYLDVRLRDNTFEGKHRPTGDYGESANKDLINTRGVGFRKEKNKKKRGSYRGGEITMQSHSIKFT